MGDRRGQAAVEAIALAGVVAAAVGVLAAGGGLRWLPAAAARAFGDERVVPTAREMAYLERAMARSGPGPTIGDAVVRLAAHVGREQAQRLVAEAILRRYAADPPGRREALADPSWALERPTLDGVGPPASDVWAEAAERAPAQVRVITRADERDWLARQRPSLAERVVSAGASAAIGVASAISPELSVAATLAGAGAAAADDDAATGVPAGSRADDALVCRFLWIRDAARPGWAAAHPVDAARLPLGRRIPAVELVVIRAGRVLARSLVQSDAARC